MNTFSFSKHKDIHVGIKYLIEVGEGARFAIKWNSGVHVPWNMLQAQVLACWATHIIPNGFCFVI